MGLDDVGVAEDATAEDFVTPWWVGIPGASILQADLGLNTNARTVLMVGQVGPKHAVEAAAQCKSCVECQLQSSRIGEVSSALVTSRERRPKELAC